MDPFPLAALDCVLVNQVLPDSERGRARKDEVGRDVYKRQLMTCSDCELSGPNSEPGCDSE